MLVGEGGDRLYDGIGEEGEDKLLPLLTVLVLLAIDVKLLVRLLLLSEFGPSCK